MAAKKKQPSKSKFKPFSWSDHLNIAITKRAFSHARTGALLARIVISMDIDSAQLFLNHLSNMGFYGTDIWYGYETYCRSDIEMFMACVELEDKAFGDHILDWKAKQALELLKGKNV